MVEALETRLSRRARFVASALMLCACLALGGCSSFSSAVSDHWPTWAGGMPNDVPPRPGSPGYAEFISHQQAKDEAAAAAGKPAAAPTVVTAPAGAAAPTAVANDNPQAMPPSARRIDDQGVVQGGLY
jgi:hypothetical protein